MAVVITPHDELASLTDDLVPGFLRALECSGARRAARAVGVDKLAAYRRRYEDGEFRRAWDAARQRRLEVAADELFFAIDQLRGLVGGSHEHAFDELINCAYLKDQPWPNRPEVCPERLAAARRRLAEAGRAWAVAVIASGDANSVSS